MWVLAPALALVLTLSCLTVLFRVMAKEASLYMLGTNADVLDRLCRMLA